MFLVWFVLVLSSKVYSAISSERFAPFLNLLFFTHTISVQADCNQVFGGTAPMEISRLKYDAANYHIQFLASFLLIQIRFLLLEDAQLANYPIANTWHFETHHNGNE